MAQHHALLHGHKTRAGMSPTYACWNNMRARCERESARSFAAYGAAGIVVCSRWRSFQNFLADMGEKPEGMTLDRINNDAGYSPENCRWATPRQQAENRACVNRLTFRGESLTLKQWSERTGVKRSTLAQRRYTYKWPTERILKEIA